MNLEARLLERIEEIAGRPVSLDEKLVGGAIDSLSLVELVNAVEELSRELGKRVDLDRLMSDESLTPARILSEIS